MRVCVRIGVCGNCGWVCVYVSCAGVCVRACMRACVCVCVGVSMCRVHVCVCVGVPIGMPQGLLHHTVMACAVEFIIRL